VQDRAPIFNSQVPGLVPEGDIAALQRACMHEREFQKEQEEARKNETKKTLEEEAKQEAEVKAITEKKIETAAAVEIAAQEPLPANLPPSRVPSFTALLVPSQVTSRFGSEASLNHLSAPAHRASVSLSNVPRIGTVEAPDTSASIFAPQTGLAATYTPHDRGHFLAYSAPGSRHASVDNTPFVSRTVSPTHGLSVRGYGHNSLLRPTASTSRLNQLLHEEGVRRALSPLAEDRSSRRPSGSGAWSEDMVANLSVAQGWIDPDDIDAFVQTVSRRPSRPSSRQLSRAHSPAASTADDDLDEGLFLPGLGHPAVIHSSSRIQSRGQSPMAAPSTSPNPRMGSVDHDAESRPPSRPYSPVLPPNYDSAESAAYLRGLAQRHYEMVNPCSRSHSALRPTTEDTHYDIGGGVELDQASRSHTPVEPVYSHGLQQRTESPTTAFPSYSSRTSTPTPTPTSYLSREPKPLNTGRPRAASQALNEAYNAANPPGCPVFTFPETAEQRTSTRSPKCAIHDETCDGKTVTQLHLTARAMRGAGFVEPFPMIKGEGEGEGEEVRYMVDWATLRDEEMERMRRGGVYLLA
jgi:hypothetical protein